MRPFFCTDCGSRFFPVSPAWGEEFCGDCIAGRLETALSTVGTPLDRKPMRRAAEREAAEANPVPLGLQRTA